MTKDRCLSSLIKGLFTLISGKYELIDNVPLKCDIDFAIMFYRHMFVIPTILNK